MIYVILAIVLTTVTMVVVSLSYVFHKRKEKRIDKMLYMSAISITTEQWLEMNWDGWDEVFIWVYFRGVERDINHGKLVYGCGVEGGEGLPPYTCRYYEVCTIPNLLEAKRIRNL